MVTSEWLKAHGNSLVFRKIKLIRSLYLQCFVKWYLQSHIGSTEILSTLISKEKTFLCPVLLESKNAFTMGANVSLYNQTVYHEVFKTRIT